METTIKQSNVETVLISINGMRCMGCVQQIHDLLLQLKGVNHVEVCLDEVKAEVEYVPATISLEQLTECIKGAGYQVGETAAIIKRFLPEKSKVVSACCCS